MHKHALLTLLLFATALAAAEKTPAPQLIQMANKEPNSPRFREALLATLKEADIHKGAAFIGEGPDFLWVVGTIAAHMGTHRIRKS